MPLADLDFTELHLTLKDGITGRPFVDPSTGLTSMDVPYEAIDYYDEMYEPRNSRLSSARVVLPSLMAMPHLRPLFQQIKEQGTRVELYNFQPDCGAPVFGGSVEPGAITEQNGVVTLDVVDTVGRGRRQHLGKYEIYKDVPAALFDRALSQWSDIVNEDWSAGVTALNNYTITPYAGTALPAWDVRGGWLQVPGGPALVEPQIISKSPIRPQLGDTYIHEAFIRQTWGSITAPWLGLTTGGASPAGLVLGTPFYFNIIGSNPTLLDVLSLLQVVDPANGSQFVAQPGGVFNLTGGGGSPPATGIPATVNNHVVLFMRCLPDGLEVTVLVDGVQLALLFCPFQYSSQLWYPHLGVICGGAGDLVEIGQWRVRKLQPWIRRAARFNPVSEAPISFQPNNEDNLSFLNFIAEADNAEYRSIYRPAPEQDLLELDVVGSLGQDVSRALRYDDLGVPAAGGAAPAPFAAAAEAGALASFRFEEGINLAEPPQRDTSAEVYANDVRRMGANPVDSQIEAEVWSVVDTGNPAAGIPAKYPYYESVSNDDRLSSLAIAKQVAQYELNRRFADSSPIGIKAVAELRDSFRYRAGDSAKAVTQSLLRNIDRSMRIMTIHYVAGSPVRDVLLGRRAWSPDQLHLILTDTVQQWLYTQGGAQSQNQQYPNTGTITAGASSPLVWFAIPSQSPNTQIVKATLQWTVDGTNGVDVLSVRPYINGIDVVSATKVTEAAPTDSGVIDVTGFLPYPTMHNWNFKNISGSDTGLSAATLTIQVKP